jgi:glycine/D-amino acid oxidase-like deaminating enzyme
MRVLILGGGVIGACIARFLALRGAEPILVERHEVAGAASGRSGGFLARDWCDGTRLMALARRSFDLHAELADALGNDWFHRRMTTFAGVMAGGMASRTVSPGRLGPDVAVTGRLGSPDTTAQVQPAAFTTAMMQNAREHGARLVHAEVTGLLRRGDAVIGATLGDEALEADAVVVAMGPWSTRVARWLALPPVYGLKGHSLVFDTGTRLPAEALFLECADATGATLAPEIFPRADGTTYVCAISSEPPVPADPAQVAPDEGAIERLAALCRRISPVLAAAPVRASGACFRPVAPDGLPLIGAVAGAPGAYVATGHSVWGILNAPATGEAMAELILDGAARTLDLAPFDPARLPPLHRPR